MTAARPEPARIDDFADPRFTPEVAAVRESLGPVADELELEVSALTAQAERETGLDDFGDPGFRERLEILCRSLRDEAGLAPFGVVSNHALLSGLLRSRLLIQDLLVRHPEIAEVPVERPIVIVGLPRTGTTHLHNLISADPALRSLPYWESLEPVLPPAERGLDPDPRLARTELALDWLDQSMPLFKRMHEMTVDHVHEEIQLLAIDFSSMLFESSCFVPTYRDYYLAHDQTPHYGYLRQVLQVLTWLRGGTRWVLKSPQHSEQLVPLLRVFPDATFVVTHRDPVAVTASVCTMIAYGARMNAAHPDPLVLGRYWSQRVEELLWGCARDRDVLPDAQAIDVRFHEYMADDLAMVRRIYEVAGQPFTDETEAALGRFMSAHPRGRHGTVVYDATALGLDLDERRRALGFYTERFGVVEELRGP
ncbi:MAG: sulfotransferase [Actinobacteria bacterium]|nr:sulfotransferase [Actinomycetota bacterium]